MSAHAPQHVTICVPVFNGATFVAETLTSIRQQTHGDITVLISDDASQDGSREACGAFLRDPRFRLVAHPARRGWIDNCNWLLANAASDLVCIQPHDDIIAPDYLARLLSTLDAEPKAVLAFCDNQLFGQSDGVRQQDSIRGDSAAQRVSAFIAQHYDGTAWRGLFRRHALDAAGFMRPNPMGNYAADVSWLARMTHAGEFHRVPERLYRKRVHARSAAYQWGLWDWQRLVDAWCMHGCEMLRDALSLTLPAEEQSLVADAVLHRVLGIAPAAPFRGIRDQPRARQIEIVEAVFSVLREARATQVLPDKNPEAALRRVLGPVT